MLLRGTFLNGVIMENKIYVGNLPYAFNDNDMQRTFSEFGSVNSASVSAQALQDGLKGPAVGARLEAARLAAIAHAL